MQNKIILATNNRGKLREFADLMAGATRVAEVAAEDVSTTRAARVALQQQPFSLVAQSELGIPEVEETGLTFVENAILKARHASLYGNLPAIADDSGLMVDALDGSPGIYSARYADSSVHGDDHSSGNDKATSFADNIAKLLLELKDVPPGQRDAHFHCVIVYLRYAKDPAPVICHGMLKGRIISTLRGNNGFGYDPVLWLPMYNCTVAELPLEVKNKISHRAQAVKQLLKILGDVV